MNLKLTLFVGEPHVLPSMKHCSAISDTFKALTPITVDYGNTKDVKAFTA